MDDRNFKIKVSTGELVVELEGDPDIVIRQFEQIKEHGLGKISPLTPPPIQTNASFNSTVALQKDQYDSLSNVVRKGLPGSEVEWVILYGFYTTNFGKNRFNREDILSRYEETNRATISRKSNLTNNIKTAINNNWIMAINDTDFIMTEEGIRMSKKILDRKGSRSTKRVGRKKKEGHGS